MNFLKKRLKAAHDEVSTWPEWEQKCSSSSRSPAGHGAWIDVDIEMPEGNKPVLIFYETPMWKSPVMAVAINFDGTGVFRILEKGGVVNNATHWMPLPDAP